MLTIAKLASLWDGLTTESAHHSTMTKSTTPNSANPREFNAEFNGKFKFAHSLLHWFEIHGRKNLPWQQNPDPYRVWVSEIMLQQTQVETVIPYYQNFIARFPSIASLAAAEQDEVMTHWAGLGYYARARNMHRAAQLVRDNHDGCFPDTMDDVLALPGIGRSTAGAILAFSFNIREPILDGNVKRVLCRFFAVEGFPGKKLVQDRLWQYSEQLTPHEDVAKYTQAIMDLGATLCIRRQPKCNQCPMNAACAAYKQGNPADYPESKSKVKRPQRKSTMLLLRNPKSQFLLIKRPPTGIWGGLWALPEISETADDIVGWCEEQYGIKTSNPKKLKNIKHGFTHFELHIQPVECPVIGQHDRVMDDDNYIWYNPFSDAAIALPAAVSKIFKQLV